MQIIIDITAQTSPLSPSQVGGKAFNLCRLYQMGIPVPAAIIIPASIHGRADIEFKYIREQILQHELISSGDKFAVRSSGVGEDGKSNSFAGIFESYLDVPKEEVPEAVIRVWDSLESPRSAMYTSKRDTSIDSMAVVVQHMVPADYAGVAFSSSPLEEDDRIALVEVVKGNGDTLVSGKKTPATLRVNKLTGMIRIARNGEDEIPDEVLEDMAQKIMPLVEKIEAEYSIPVDIEWAMANGEIFILQARPITV